MTDSPIDLNNPIDPETVIGVNERYGSNVLDEANQMFASAVQTAAQRHGGERVRWGVSLMPLPTEQRDEGTGAPQLVMVLVLYLSIPGATLGTNISSTSLLDIEERTQDTTDEQVYNLLGGALDARSRQLDQQAIDEAEAAAKGRTMPTSGLISTNGQPLRANGSEVEERAALRYVHGDEEPSNEG